MPKLDGSNLSRSVQVPMSKIILVIPTVETMYCTTSHWGGTLGFVQLQLTSFCVGYVSEALSAAVLEHASSEVSYNIKTHTSLCTSVKSLGGLPD